MKETRKAYPRPKLMFGFYRHYKGGIFDVYGLSQQEATGEWDVLYRNPRSHEPFHMPHKRFIERRAQSLLMLVEGQGLTSGAPARFEYVGAAPDAIDCTDED